MNPLSFRQAVNALTTVVVEYQPTVPYVLSDKATNSYADFCNSLDYKGYYLMSTQGNDKSIYPTPLINIMARSWHDDTHWQHSLDFSLKSEIEVYSKQAEYIERALAHRTKETIRAVKTLLYCDVVLQAKYYNDRGTFITDQHAYVKAHYNRIADMPN